ncbi:MAG: AI-2E family transporter [Paracoccus sp. (in: a-proteobacteria)]|uniref:AI-2E family transporter n=1 Tax=Paracoccus sp. TaxID=267 RepID=UPI0040585A6E
MSKNLLMQLIVNVTYGIPMALGLWAIGVPGRVLWGTLAAIMRFIPYVGPLLSAAFLLALAFAVDPGWQMVLMAPALILFLELVSNNIVEPFLCGTSTGLSALSSIAAATFWTALWGPLGLILSTPLTVCLLVQGRNVPQMAFFGTLPGSAPALNLPRRIYQRLIASDPEEAYELASESISASIVTEFYDDIELEVLRQTSKGYHSHARVKHRLRVVAGMDRLLEKMREDHLPLRPVTPLRSVSAASGRSLPLRPRCWSTRWRLQASPQNCGRLASLLHATSTGWSWRASTRSISAISAGIPTRQYVASCAVSAVAGPTCGSFWRCGTHPMAQSLLIGPKLSALIRSCCRWTKPCAACR